MITLPDNPTREEVFRFISESASYGNLGLFIGTGFSKAVLNDEFDKIALSWGQLLQQATVELNVNYNVISKEGYSYPEIASRLCQVYSQEKQIPYKEALSKLKGVIANLTCWYPDPKKERSSLGI